MYVAEVEVHVLPLWNLIDKVEFGTICCTCEKYYYAS